MIFFCKVFYLIFGIFKIIILNSNFYILELSQDLRLFKGDNDNNYIFYTYKDEKKVIVYDLLTKN